jgi:hypothetical protein
MEAVRTRADLKAALQAGCGADIRSCAQDDTGRLSNPAMNQAAYDVTQTYGLPVVYPKNARGRQQACPGSRLSS